MPWSARSRSAGTLLLSGCGDQTKDKGAPADSTKNAPLADKLPKEIRDKGVIKVGSDIAYAPVEFKDKSGNTAGIDPDLAAAMGKQLGVKFEFQNGTFDTLITGLRSKRYDIAMSAMTDTKDRQNGVDSDTGKKVGEGVDFVDYFDAGVSIYTPKGKTQGIKTWDDLCGKKIVVQRGTVSHDLAKAQAKKCPAGKKLAIESFDDDQQAQTRLRSGGADSRLLRLPGRRVRGEDRGRRQGLRARRRAGRGRPVRHRGRQGQHRAAGRPEGGARRRHQERRVREDHREVGRRGGLGQGSLRQRRQVTASLSSASRLKGNTRVC